MKPYTPFITSPTFIHTLISAAAVPSDANVKGTLNKRGGEVNYLVNCRRLNWDDGSSDYSAEYMAWYPNVKNSLNRQRPIRFPKDIETGQLAVRLPIENSFIRVLGANAQCMGGFLDWEGRQQDIHVKDSGATVQTHIDTDC